MGWTRNVRHRFFTKGGVHPPTRKQTASKNIVPGPVTDSVVIPLQQSVGPICAPVVNEGDRVLLGQKIGDSEAFVSSPVHASVSGTVKEIVKFPHPGGEEVLSVRIENDKQDEPVNGLVEAPDPLALAPDEIRSRIHQAGIVGLGGAAFPTHVKLSPPSDKPIELVILNGSECEPYLTGDYRLMIERSEEIARGGLLVKKAVGAEKVVVGIEHKYAAAIEAMRRVCEKYGIEIVELPCRYPTGAEKTLVKAVTGHEVPSGGLPMDVGVLVNNVGTCAQIFDSLSTGMPLISRVLTVSGDGVAGRANLRVRIGTLLSDVIDFCGGLVGEPGKLIVGGPMMGLSQYTMGIPVIKSTSGIIALRGESMFTGDAQHFECIRCGRCVRRCPQNLMPYQMGAFADAGMWDQLDKFNVNDCVECGSCAFICPTKNPLVQLIKVGKGSLRQRKEKIEALTDKDEAAREEDEKETVNG